MDMNKQNLLEAAKLACSVIGIVGDAPQRSAMTALHQAINAIEEERTERETYYFSLAKERVIEGDIEVDDDAVVSISDDDGAYVQAWIWVE